MSIGPITSPYFQQGTPWPYIKGPNYTRPVFGENTRGGAFMISPLIRMPSLNGLGCARGCGSDAPDPTASVPSTPPATTPPTPASTCETVKPAGEAVYNQCIAFNTKLAQADAATNAKMTADINAADKKCGDITDFNQWAACYYGALSGVWYRNPLYLGGAIIGGAVALGLLTRYLRSRY